jgi:hypothetical protein
MSGVLPEAVALGLDALEAYESERLRRSADIEMPRNQIGGSAEIKYRVQVIRWLVRRAPGWGQPSRQPLRTVPTTVLTTLISGQVSFAVVCSPSAA